ncbi:MAG TPA: hypothetical protein VFG10_14400 [Saprospiraceae bacterium]|nr:hypothetical protein [Saprospiraceae bacterium]
MRKSCILFAIAAYILYQGCSSDGTKKPKYLNPNGDSELALLMRDMYDDGMLTKQQILDGTQPEINVKYHQLHTAKATEPEKVADPDYTTYATLYEASVKSFLESNKENRVESYHFMINACMNCHKSICPGPTVKIKHMYLSEKEMASLVRQ